MIAVAHIDFTALTCLHCFPQQASTCFKHPITTSSMGLRFTLTLKMRRQAPVAVTVKSLTAVQMGGRKTASQRKQMNVQQMGRHASKTE